jgi:serine/threonine protein kinase
MLSEIQDENLEKINETTPKSNLLGQGSYGCVYYPGITCSGKTNKQKVVTKLQEISFYSLNEIEIGKYIKKHIPKYQSMYAPIIKFCIVSFQTIQKSSLHISECDTLFPKSDSDYHDYDDYYDYHDYDYNKSRSDPFKNKLDTKYYLMYMNYIYNKTLKNYFQEYKIYDLYVVDFVKVCLILINNIGYLVSTNICHNDLHVNNILVNLKNIKPIIIDFGLSMYYNKCYKKKKNIDFEYLKMLLFDFRDDQYHITLEKRFISFIIYNKSSAYNATISNNYVKNELTQSVIDLFITDSYNSIANQKVITLNKVDLAEYYKSLKQFYYQFLNKHKYPNYNVIVNYLLQYVFIYTDLYSLVFDIFYINTATRFNTNKVTEYDSDKVTAFDSDKVTAFDSDKVDESVEGSGPSKLFFDFFLQLLKKNLHPNPLMRLQYGKIIKIYDYIITTIKKSQSNLVYDTFIKELNLFLTAQSINPKILFNKKFAYLDFRIIISYDVFNFVKNKF